MRQLLSMLLVITFLLTSTLHAQPRDGQRFRGGQGFRGGQEPQGRPGPGAFHGDERHEADHEVFQFLLSNHDKIKRTVKELSNGVETLTESDTPEIAAKIKEHVEWMEHRIEEPSPIRMRDPLFAEIFKHAKQIKMSHEETAKGVRVTETSEDKHVVKLIQAHAKVVTGFVERGFVEAMKNHAVPDASTGAKVSSPTNPVILKHGAVVRLPDAAHQPREGTKILIDVTRGSEPNELNAALDKVAKYVNIYAGGGEKPAKAQFAVIFHGDATLAVLNDDAYAAMFKTKGNPNLELLHQLHEQGVELFVCGQTLISKQAKPEEVATFVDTAVSALTVVVNLQGEGYARIPLGK